MKYKILLRICFTMFLAWNVNAQQNQSLTGMMEFESTPVSLSTGTPNINIPLFVLPSYSEKVNIDLSLHYNPASVAYMDSLSGNCGRGWTLSNGGAILREYKGTAGGNVYQFNFLGYSGKFEVRNIGTGFQAVISENKGANLNIFVGSSLGQINSFTISDDQGINYVFSNIEQFVHVDSYFTPPTRVNFRSAYRLTEIVDENQLLIASYIYDTYEAVEPYYQGSEKTILKEIKEIIVPGTGRAVFQKVFDGYLKTVNIQNCIVYNMLNNPIKRFDFTINNRKLKQVDISDPGLTSGTSYKLFYKNILPIIEDDAIGPDKWGFYTYYNKMCQWYPSPTWTPSEAQFLVNPVYVLRDVLEKMTLPGGGCVIYEFESNSYSHKAGADMESSPDFFFVNNLQNRHNFIQTAFTNHHFAAGNNDSFHLSSPGPGKLLYFRFDGERRLEPLTENGNVYIYTHFQFLNGNTNLFTYGKSEHLSPHPSYANTESACSGISFTVPSTGYTIKTAPQGYYGSISAYTMELKSNARKCHYGNGIRIKRIGYFEDGAVNQRYYTNGSPGHVPVKEINYDYNFFDNSIKSSGSTAESVISTTPKRGEPIWYKNVTVSQAGMGRTTYDFFSPIDFTVADATSKFKFGRPKDVKVYDENGTLLKSTNYSYDYTYVDVIAPRQLTMSTGQGLNIGFSKPSEIVEKSFYPDSQSITTLTALTYGSNREVMTKSITTGDGDTFLTKYFYATYSYWWGASARTSEIERVENYKNSDLLSTTKVNYSNSWAVVDEGYGTAAANERYLPASTQTAKGTQSLLTGQHFNLYNRHNRLLESEKDKGIKTVYLWGYKNSQIVAKIENAAYADIPKATIDAIRAASDSGNEAALLTALASLRNLPILSNAMVTTYTYKPLIGLSSVTNPQGQKQTYEYDSSNRLKLVRDQKGKILSENEYHYRAQL